MAGFEAGSIIARVKADISDFKDGMENAQHHAGRFHDGLNAVGGGVKLLAKGLAIGGAAAAAFGGLAAKEFSESEDAAAQLNAVLRSTGEAAGVTAKQANDLADAFSKETKFSDEAVLSAESMLLTFTSVGKEVFPQATQTILDMSQALGQDTKSSAIQLGKALNDPIQGVTALRRVGVSFNDAQLKSIETMQTSGNLMGAQKLILNELSKEFGGSAQAAGQTFSGQLIIAKNTFSNFMETIGQGIVMKIAPLLQKFNEWVDSVGGVDGAIKVVQETLVNFWNSIVNLVTPALNLLLAVWEFLKPSVTALANTIATELWPALQRLWDLLSPILIPVLKVLAVILGATIIGALYLAINVINVAVNVITTLVGWLSNLIHWGRTAAGVVGDAFAVIKASALETFNQVWGSIQSVLNKFSEIVGAVRHSLSGMWDVVKQAIGAPIDWAKDKVNELINKLKDLNPLQRHSPSLFDLINKGTSMIKNEYSDMFGSIGDMAQRFSAVNLSPSLMNPNPASSNRVNTQIYGNINIGSDVDADNFMARLTKNQELAQRGLTTL